MAAETTPISRLVQMYRSVAKSYKDLDKDPEKSDSEPVYLSDQEMIDSEWGCEYLSLYGCHFTLCRPYPLFLFVCLSL